MGRREKINFDPRLVEARADWANHLKQLMNRGIGGDQRWPFPENLKDTKRRLKEAQIFLLEHPDTIGQGGLFEPYRNKLENLLDIYDKISSGKSERFKTTWILVTGIVGRTGVIRWKSSSGGHAWQLALQ
jgi:hypothetical protein